LWLKLQHYSTFSTNPEPKDDIFIRSGLPPINALRTYEDQLSVLSLFKAPHAKILRILENQEAKFLQF